MTEADSGSGNGAAVQSSAETGNVPQAQGDAITIGKSELDALVASAAAKAVSDAKDSIFAEARRTFTGSKKDKAPAPADPATPTQSADAMRMRALDRALSKHGLADRLSDAQYKRVEKLFVEESPDDAATWVKDYFDGFGVAPSQPATTNQAAQPAKPVAEHPVSNRGAPPPAQVPIDELDLFTASDSDRAAFIKAKGPKAYLAQLQKQGKGRPVRLG